MPDTWLTILILLGGVGVVLLVSVACFWSGWWQRLYSEWKAKTTAEIISFVPAMVGVFVTVANSDEKARWLSTLLAGGAVIVVWRIAFFVADARSKEWERNRHVRLVAVERIALNRIKLMRILSGLLRRRVERIEAARTELASSGAAASIRHARQAFDPEQHVNDILEHLVAYFQSLRPDTEETQRADVRIGLYVAQERQAVPIHWFSVKQRFGDIYRSFRDHPDHFRLDTLDRPAHVVRCLNERRHFLVPDCVAAAERGEFRFFGESQRTYLRSLIVYPLGDLPLVAADGRVELFRAALVADSDLPDYFQQDDEVSYREGAEYFQTRLLLEFNLRALLNAGTRP